MFAMILVIDCIITDLIRYMLCLLQLNNCIRSYKHTDKYLPFFSFLFLCKKTRQMPLSHGYRLGIPHIYEHHPLCSPPT